MFKYLIWPLTVHWNGVHLFPKNLCWSYSYWYGENMLSLKFHTHPKINCPSILGLSVMFKECSRKAGCANPKCLPGKSPEASVLNQENVWRLYIWVFRCSCVNLTKRVIGGDGGKSVKCLVDTFEKEIDILASYTVSFITVYDINCDTVPRFNRDRYKNCKAYF